MAFMNEIAITREIENKKAIIFDASGAGVEMLSSLIQADFLDYDVVKFMNCRGKGLWDQETVVTWRLVII